jgi:hypothetical protein
MIGFNHLSCSNFSSAYRDARLSAPCNEGSTLDLKDLDTVIAKIKDRTGVVTTHLVRIQEVAKEQNCVIALRPVETAATGLIESGWPTKGLHVKGKSSNWGVQAGTIPLDQTFSKLEKYKSTAPEIIKIFNQQTNQCVREKHAIPVQLKVSKQRIDYLLENNFIYSWHTLNHNQTIKINAIGLSGDTYEYEGIQCEDSPTPEYLIFQGQQPLMVLAKEPHGNPLTADYDLLLIGPHLSDIGPLDNLPLPDVSHDVFKQRLDKYMRIPDELKIDYQDEKHFYSKANPDKGNITTRAAQMIPLLNQAMVGEGEPVIHHGTDSANHISDTAANYPATFILPTKMSPFEEIVIVENQEQFAELVKVLKDYGHHIPINPLWESRVKNVRRTSLTDAISALGQ